MIDAIIQSSTLVRMFNHNASGNITTDTRGAITYNYRYNNRARIDRLTVGRVQQPPRPDQYFLLESGLHYNWHRHYDPTIGRYLQTDPMRRRSNRC